MKKRLLIICLGLLIILVLVTAINKSRKFNIEKVIQMGEKGVPTLEEALKSKDLKVKGNAIFGLSRIGGPATPVLLDELQKEIKKKESKVDYVWTGSAWAPKVTKGEEEKVNFSRDILRALGHIKDRRIINPLSDIIFSKEKIISPHTKVQAVETLGILGTDEHTPLPSTYIPQAEPGKGQEIKAEDRAAIRKVLTVVLKSEYKEVRQAAANALELIATGE